MLNRILIIQDKNYMKPGHLSSEGIYEKCKHTKSNKEKQSVFIPSGSVVTWKTGPFRVPEISSKDEIQVFKNLRTPVLEELIFLNVF